MRPLGAHGLLAASAVLAALTLAAERPTAEAHPTGSARREESESWPQWGGPTRDFRAPVAGLARTWPGEGPPVLWRRALGEGDSAILYESGRLYTLYRSGGDEVVVCLDAGSGETLWEHRYAAAYAGLPGYGSGPRATPMLVGDRLFTAGVAGSLLALDKRDGELLWRRELWGPDFGGNVLGHGYASSPLAWRDLVVVAVGGDGAGLVAFEQATGDVAWKALDSRNSYSSPCLFELLGEEQIVAFMSDEVVGVAPASGELRWRHPHDNQWKHNISLPIAVGGDTIVLSSPQAGSRGLRLAREGESIGVEQVWATRRVQFYHSSTVRLGDRVYGSSGTVASTLLAAIDVGTGEIAWRRRGFAKANVVGADGRLLILDENGRLYLASPSPDGLEVDAEAQLLDPVAWTVPTLVGRTLYARDRKQILAADLG